jgi:hypothetical protein
MQVDELPRNDACVPSTGRKLTWALWAFATLVTLAFARPGYLVAHDLEHQLGSVIEHLSSFSKASIFVTARLATVAAGFGAASALLIVRMPAAGRAIVAFQVLAFVGLCALLAQGMLAPFECMCKYTEGLVD